MISFKAIFRLFRAPLPLTSSSETKSTVRRPSWEKIRRWFPLLLWVPRERLRGRAGGRAAVYCRYVGRGRGRFLCTLQRAAWCIRALALRFSRPAAHRHSPAAPRSLEKGDTGEEEERKDEERTMRIFCPRDLGHWLLQREELRRGEARMRRETVVRSCVSSHPPSPTIIPCLPTTTTKRMERAMNGPATPLDTFPLLLLPLKKTCLNLEEEEEGKELPFYWAAEKVVELNFKAGSGMQLFPHFRDRENVRK